MCWVALGQTGSMALGWGWGPGSPWLVLTVQGPGVAGSWHASEEVWCRKSLCRALSADIWESAVPCHSLPGRGGAPTWVMAGKQLPALARMVSEASPGVNVAALLASAAPLH